MMVQGTEMSKEEENELVRRAAGEKDQLALSKLLVKYHPLFMKVTHDRKYALLGEEAQEIAQLYFLEAVNTFEASRGVPFAAYLKLKIEWGLRDFLAGALEKKRREKDTDGTLDGLGERSEREGDGLSVWDAAFLKGRENLSSGSAEMGGLGTRMDSFQQVDMRDALARAMASLPPGERTVVEKIYFKDCPAKEVALQLGLSASRISHLKNAALKKLRGFMQ